MMLPSASFQILCPMDEYSQKKIEAILKQLEAENDPRNYDLIETFDKLAYDQRHYSFSTDNK